LVAAGRSIEEWRAHLVPLTVSALEIIREPPRRDKRSRLFGEGEGGFSGWSKAKLALDKRIATADAAWRLGRCTTCGAHARPSCTIGLACSAYRRSGVEHRAHKQGVRARTT